MDNQQNNRRELAIRVPMHGEKNFPARKELSKLDINLLNGAGDEEYLAILSEHIPRILDGFKPDFVFYQAGVDPFEKDRLGKLQLTIEGLRRRDEFVILSCRERGIPVATTMGGGYAKANCLKFSLTVRKDFQRFFGEWENLA